MELPLARKVLCAGQGKAENLPFSKGVLESHVVPGLGRVEGAVHIGVEENAEVGWKLEVVQTEDVVSVCGGLVWIDEKCFEMTTGAGKVHWIHGGEYKLSSHLNGCGAGCGVSYEQLLGVDV